MSTKSPNIVAVEGAVHKLRPSHVLELFHGNISLTYNIFSKESNVSYDLIQG